MFAERFKELRKSLGLSQTEIARTLDVKPPSISQIESGKIKLSLENLSKISRTYDINLHWLLTGSGSMFASKMEDLSKLHELLTSTQHLQGDETAVTMPVVAEISAGQPVEAINDEPLCFVSLSRDLVPNPANYLCFRVNGNSMEPEVNNEDIVLIKKNLQWKNANQCICAVRVDGEITLKRLIKSKTGPFYILESINKSYDPIIVNPADSEFTLIGELSYLMRQY